MLIVDFLCSYVVDIFSIVLEIRAVIGHIFFLEILKCKFKIFFLCSIFLKQPSWLHIELILTQSTAVPKHAFENNIKGK